MRFVGLVSVLAVLAAVGCTAAGREATFVAQEETTTNGPPPVTSEQKTQPQYGTEDEGDKHILLCQIDEAAKDNQAGTGENTKQGEFIDGVYREAEEREVEPEQVLSERGYDCGWSALQE